MILILKDRKTFYRYKRPILLEDVSIDNVLVSKKISSGEKSYKYLIGYV